MIFSKRNKNINPIYLNINSNVIEHVHQFNFLGLHLNSKLTWNTHIEEISKKISRYSATDKLLFAMLGLRYF